MDEQTPEVYLGDDNIVHITFDGDLDEARATRIMDKTMKLCGEQRAKGKKALIMAYMTDKGDTSLEARNVIAKAVESDQYDKVAAYGPLPFVQHLANFVVMATGTAERAHVCNSEEEARAWLAR